MSLNNLNIFLLSLMVLSVSHNFAVYAQIADANSDLNEIHNEIDGLKNQVNKLNTTVNENNFSMIAATWGAAIGALGAMFIGLYYYQKQNLMVKKQIETSTLIEILGLLNSMERKKARYAVYEAHNKFKINPSDLSIFENSEYRKQASMVRDDFQQIGALIKNELIPKSVFLDTFCITVIMCWKALQENIKKTEKNRNIENWLPSFQWLYDQAEIHWKATRGEETKSPEPTTEFDSESNKTTTPNCPTCGHPVQ